MKSIIIFIFFIALLVCCSSRQEKDELEIEVVEINSWLNLMPGSPGKFFLQGELAITNRGEEEIIALNIESISVYSGMVSIYNFKPYFESDSHSKGNSISSNATKNFRFGTEEGLKINEITYVAGQFVNKLKKTFGYQ